MAYEIFTYGYGDMMQTILNAVAAICSSDNFVGIVTTAGTVYLLYKMLMMVFGREGDIQSIFKNMVLLLLVIYSLTQIRASVIVTDLAVPSKSGTVDNVPISVALPLYFTNRAEYILTNLFETALSVPGGVSYITAGYAGGVKNVLDTALYAQVTDPYLKESVIQYYKDCVFAALLDGLISPTRIKEDKVVDVIQAVGSLEPSRITVEYTNSTPEGIPTTCQTAASDILNRINTDKQKTFADVAEILGYPETTLATYLQNEFNYYMGISDTAQDTIYQEALLTVSKDALISKAAEAGIDPNQLGLTIASAKEKMFLSNISAGENIRDMLPKIKAIMVMIAILITPLILIFGLITGKPLKYGATALGIYTFPVFWGVLAAFVNWWINSYLADVHGLIATTSASSATINIANYPLVMMKMKEALATAGLLATMIPVFSLLIMSGSAYAFVRVAGGISSSIVGASSGAAASIATGNLAFGNVSVGNAGYNNTSMNHYDATATFGSGVQISQVDTMNKLFARVREAKDINTAEIANSKAGKVTTTPSAGATVQQATNVHDTKGVNKQSTVSTQGTDTHVHGSRQSDDVTYGSTQNFANNQLLGKNFTTGRNTQVNDIFGYNAIVNWLKQAGYLLDSKNTSTLGQAYREGVSNNSLTQTALNLGGGLQAGTGAGGGRGFFGGKGAGGRSRLAAYGSLVNEMLPKGSVGLGLQGTSQVQKSTSHTDTSSISNTTSDGNSYREQVGLNESWNKAVNASIARMFSGNDTYADNKQLSTAASIQHSTGEGEYSGKSHQYTVSGTDSTSAVENKGITRSESFSSTAPVSTRIPDWFYSSKTIVDMAKRDLQEKGVDKSFLDYISAEDIVALDSQIQGSPINELVKAYWEKDSAKMQEVLSEYGATKEEAQNIIDKARERAGEGAFNTALAETVSTKVGKGQKEINAGKQRITAEGRKTEEEAQRAKNRVEANKARAEGEINQKKHFVEQEHWTQLSKALENVARHIPDQATLEKAFSALQKNDQFKAAGIYLGVRKAGDLVSWAAHNPEAVKGFLDAVKASAGWAANIVRRNPEAAVILALGAAAYEINKEMEKNPGNTQMMLDQIRKEHGIPAIGSPQAIKEYEKQAEAYFKELQKVSETPHKAIVWNGKVAMPEEKLKKLFNTGD
jgi:hypothetical protein